MHEKLAAACLKYLLIWIGTLLLCHMYMSLMHMSQKCLCGYFYHMFHIDSSINTRQQYHI